MFVQELDLNQGVFPCGNVPLLFRDSARQEHEVAEVMCRRDSGSNNLGCFDISTKRSACFGLIWPKLCISQP